MTIITSEWYQRNFPRNCLSKEEELSLKRSAADGEIIEHTHEQDLKSSNNF